jgi:hypothetical protein
MYGRCFLLTLLVGAIACGPDMTAPNPVARTYSIYMVDDQKVPIVIPQDSSCATINSGGWLSLAADGAYSMVLDRTTVVCDNVAGVSTAIIQGGTYLRTDDSVLSFRPAQGPGFIAAFDPGTYTPALGGVIPNVKFGAFGHRYWLLAEPIP